MKSKLLKNALAIGLAVVMSIGVAGCGAPSWRAPPYQRSENIIAGCAGEIYQLFVKFF